MADIIATREDCNGIKSGSFSSNLKRCVTRAEVESVGLAVSGWTGTSKQLVPYKYIYYPIRYILTITPSSTWNGEVGDSRQYEATLYTYRGSTQIASEPVTTKVTWSAGNSRVSINSSGYATINSSGSTTITATYSSYGVSDSVSVSAINKVRQYLTLEPSSTTCYVGDKPSFTAYLTTTTNGVDGSPVAQSSTKITWSSSDTNVATVLNGTLTTKKSGTTTITGKSKTYTSLSATASVTVQDKVSYYYSVVPSSWNAEVGDTTSFMAYLVTVTNGVESVATSPSSVSWLTSNGNVVTVNSTGYATAQGEGNAEITASKGGVTGTATVTVTEPEPVIEYRMLLNNSSWNSDIGDTKSFAATIYKYIDGVRVDSSMTVVTSSASWSSSNSSVVDVYSDGSAEMVGSGNATITASFSGTLINGDKVSGVSASCSVHVYSYTYTVLGISPTSWAATAGDTQAFTLSVRKMRDDGIVTTVTNPSGTSWASTNTIYVRMSGNVATAVFPGTAQVKGTFNGTTKTANVTVTEASKKEEITYTSIEISFGNTYKNNSTNYLCTNWTTTKALPCNVTVSIYDEGNAHPYRDIVLSQGSSSGTVSLRSFDKGDLVIGRSVVINGEPSPKTYEVITSENAVTIYKTIYTFKV